MKKQVSVISSRPTTPIEIFANENYLEEPKTENLKE